MTKDFIEALELAVNLELITKEMASKVATSIAKQFIREGGE